MNCGYSSECRQYIDISDSGDNCDSNSCKDSENNSDNRKYTDTSTNGANIESGYTGDSIDFRVSRNSRNVSQ